MLRAAVVLLAAAAAASVHASLAEEQMQALAELKDYLGETYPTVDVNLALAAFAALNPEDPRIVLLGEGFLYVPITSGGGPNGEDCIKATLDFDGNEVPASALAELHRLYGPLDERTGLSGNQVSNLCIPLEDILNVVFPGVLVVSAYRGYAQAGSVVQTAGKRVHLTEHLQRILPGGGRGRGQTICVLSDGIDSVEFLQELGALPFIHVPDGEEGYGDEGTAMLEIIHALAPEAELMFATAVYSQWSFARNIKKLALAGCDIIVDDIIYYDEYNCGEGRVAKAINYVVEELGVVYVSAAGNGGNIYAGTSTAWSDNVLRQPVTSWNNRWKNAVVWDPADGVSPAPLNTLTDTTEELDSILNDHLYQLDDYARRWQAFYEWIVIQWCDVPQHVWGGKKGKKGKFFGRQPENDFDLFIFDRDLERIIGASIGDSDPLEFIPSQAFFHFYTGSYFSQNYAVLVMEYQDSAETPAYLRLNGFASNGKAPMWEVTRGGSMYGHACARANVVVGGVEHSGHDALGFSGDEALAGVNSDGPCVHKVDTYEHTKIDVVFDPTHFVALTGALTYGEGEFHGTSAAAPHFAGLLGDLFSIDPYLSPIDHLQRLADTATDYPPKGYDNHSGFGAVDAYQTLGLTPIVDGDHCRHVEILEDRNFGRTCADKLGHGFRPHSRRNAFDGALAAYVGQPETVLVCHGAEHTPAAIEVHGYRHFCEIATATPAADVAADKAALYAELCADCGFDEFAEYVLHGFSHPDAPPKPCPFDKPCLIAVAAAVDAAAEPGDGDESPNRRKRHADHGHAGGYGHAGDDSHAAPAPKPLKAYAVIVNPLVDADTYNAEHGASGDKRR